MVYSWQCFVYVTIFITHQQMWVTDENNRRIIGMLGRIIGEIFKNCNMQNERHIRLRPTNNLLRTTCTIVHYKCMYSAIFTCTILTQWKSIIIYMYNIIVTKLSSSHVETILWSSLSQLHIILCTLYDFLYCIPYCIVSSIVYLLASTLRKYPPSEVYIINEN